MEGVEQYSLIPMQAIFTISTKICILSWIQAGRYAWTLCTYVNTESKHADSVA